MTCECQAAPNGIKFQGEKAALSVRRSEKSRERRALGSNTLRRSEKEECRVVKEKKKMSVMHSSESMSTTKNLKKKCSHGCFTAERRQADCQKQPCKLVACKAIESLMVGLK